MKIKIRMEKKVHLSRARRSSPIAHLHIMHSRHLFLFSLPYCEGHFQTIKQIYQLLICWPVWWCYGIT